MVPFPKIVINLPGTYDLSYPIKENPIGSAVSEIFGTDRRTDKLYYKDNKRIKVLYERCFINIK